MSSLGVWNGDSGDDFLRRDDVQQVPANGVNLTERELYEFGESCKSMVFLMLRIVTEHLLLRNKRNMGKE